MITMRNIWIIGGGVVFVGGGAGKTPPFLTAILNMETGKR